MTSPTNMLAALAARSPFTLEDAHRASGEKGHYTIALDGPDSREKLMRVHASLSIRWAKAVLELAAKHT